MIPDNNSGLARLMGPPTQAPTATTNRWGGQRTAQGAANYAARQAARSAPPGGPVPGSSMPPPPSATPDTAPTAAPSLAPSASPALINSAPAPPTGGGTPWGSNNTLGLEDLGNPGLTETDQRYLAGLGYYMNPTDSAAQTNAYNWGVQGIAQPGTASGLSQLMRTPGQGYS